MRRCSVLACLSLGAILPGCGRMPLRAPKAMRGFEICTPFSEGMALVLEKKTRQYGYVNREGGLAIPARFAQAQPFAEGLAAVQLEQWGKYGYIDAGGKVAIEPAFDAAFPFCEGLAAVGIDGKYGYVEKTGRVRIEPQFERAFAFSGGRAKIVRGGLAGFIDAQGRVAVEPLYFKAGRFRDGLAMACTQSTCGFVDAEGRTAIGFEYEDAGDFSGGFAPVRRAGKWGYLDTKGKWLVEPSFDEAHAFQDDAALVGKVMGSQPDRGYGAYTGTTMVHGYIDRRGKFLIEFAVRQASSFSEGLARISVPSGGFCSDCYETAYLRKDGTLVGRYGFGGDFAGGVAVVKGGASGTAGFLIDGKGKALVEFDQPRFEDPLRAAALPASIRFGYLDRTGAARIAHEFTAAEPFSEGLALVSGPIGKGRRRQVFIDRTGAVKLETPPDASRVEPFLGGFALIWFYSKASGGHRFGYMNRAGTVQIEAPYKEARGFSEGLAAVKTTGAAGRNDWGYIDEKGRLAIPAGFTHAGPFLGGLAQVAYVQDTYIHSGLIDRSGKVLLQSMYEPERRDEREYRRRHARAKASRDLIPARDRNGFGYVNREGAFAIRDKSFMGGDGFSEGLAPVMMAAAGGTPLWGYIDGKGVVAIEPVFREAHPFSEGLALVREAGGRVGYIRRDGSWAVLPGFYEDADSFSEGLALVKVNGLYGFLDVKGGLAIRPRYVRAASFSDGLAMTGIEAGRPQRASRPRPKSKP